MSFHGTAHKSRSMKTTPRSVALVFFLLFTFSVQAQIVPSPYEIGLQVGIGVYNGDITSTVLDSYRTPGGFIGINGSRKLSKKFALRADISFGHLHASDSNFSAPEYKRQRNFGFRTSVTETSLKLVWKPIGEDHLLIPYLFGGVGYDFIKITRDFSKFNADFFFANPELRAGLAEDTAQKLPNNLLTLPIGIGFRYAISDRLSLSLETTYNITNSDYLDGFSKAANPKRKDRYATHTIGLIYSFAGKNLLACPRK